MCDRLLAMSLATTLGLAGCSTDDDRMAGDSLPEGKYPLTFSIAVEGLNVTRATTDNTWTGNEVVAVQVGGVTKKYKPVSYSASTTLEATNDETPFYWQKSDETKKVSAWYLGTGYQEELPATWTVQSDQREAGYQRSDFLYAPETSIGFADRNTTSLTFYHQTAKVVINILNADAVTDAAQITDVSLVNMSTTADYTAPQGGSTAGTWSNQSTPAETGITPKTLADNTGNILKSYTALVVPQQMKDKKFIKVTIGADVDARDYYYTPTTETDGKLEAGNQYTYNITVKKDKLEVTASSSVSWKDDVTTDDAQEAATFRINYEEGMTLEAVDGKLTNDGARVKILSGSNLLKVTVKKQAGKFLKGISVGSKYYTIQSWKGIDNGYEIIYQLKSDVTLTSLFVDPPAPEIGSYYYADGEWSSEWWNRPCIGIVFKVGKDEHDNNSYDKPTKVQGYVVALQDAPGGRQPFGSGADISSFTTNTTDFKGYAACQSMKGQSKFSADTHWACYSALHYTPEAPTASSGWYLPSLGEWNVLWQNYSTVQAKFATAGGSDMRKSSGFYWSMSKINEGNSQPALVDFGVWDGYRTFSRNIKTGTFPAYTRPILTF